VSSVLGPLAGGLIVRHMGWPWVFWINVPVGLAAILLTLRFIPESRAPRPRRFDPIGQALVIVLLVGLTYGIIEAPGSGWTSPQIVAAFAASAAALLGLLLYEPRRDEPLVDLRFFRSIPFSASIGLSVAAFASFGGFLFLNTLYLTVISLAIVGGHQIRVGGAGAAAAAAGGSNDRRRSAGGQAGAVADCRAKPVEIAERPLDALTVAV